MKRLFLIILMCVAEFYSFSQKYNGVYGFNKGINKANGNLLLFHFKPDSAFFFLNAISGMPEFLNADIKGFMSIDSTHGFYQIKEKCSIDLDFSKTTIKIHQDSSCTFEFPFDGTYKKMNTVLKKTSTMMLNFVEKKAVSKLDTLEVYEVPHPLATSKKIKCEATILRVIDEYQQYYLIEHPKYKTEFMWVLKKSIFIQKK